MLHGQMDCWQDRLAATAAAQLAAALSCWGRLGVHWCWWQQGCHLRQA